MPQKWPGWSGKARARLFEEIDRGESARHRRVTGCAGQEPRPGYAWLRTDATSQGSPRAKESGTLRRRGVYLVKAGEAVVSANACVGSSDEPSVVDSVCVVLNCGSCRSRD